MIGVNRSLLDVAAAHHVTVLADLETGTGPNETSHLLRECLEAVEEGHRLLASGARSTKRRSSARLI